MVIRMKHLAGAVLRTTCVLAVVLCSASSVIAASTQYADTVLADNPVAY